jgi:predicted transcriptional regulator YdeE
MPYKVTIVDLPDVKLMVSRADEFPSGIKAAWDRLESKLPSLKGRKFYGMTVCEGSGLAYFAGVEVVSDQEAPSLGFPTMMIKGGRYARAKLLDWSDHTDMIGEIFGELMRDFPMDPNGPSVEFYRSQSELHLLIPLVECDG